MLYRLLGSSLIFIGSVLLIGLIINIPTLIGEINDPIHKSKGYYWGYLLGTLSFEMVLWAVTYLSLKFGFRIYKKGKVSKPEKESRS